MNEQERRQEILKAEEAIRQLAAEMARATSAASQADAAREKLEEAKIAVIKTVGDLQEAIITQKSINSKATDNLNQAKKSLEDAISALADASMHIDRIETHIIVAVNEIKAATKIVESSPVRLSTALSKELSQANKTAEERHKTSMQVLKDNSVNLKNILMLLENNHKEISESLVDQISQVDKKMGLRYNAEMQALESNSTKIQGISLSIEEGRNTTIKALERDSNKLQEITNSLDKNQKSISNLLVSQISEINKQTEAGYNAAMHALGDNSNKLQEISQSIEDNHKKIVNSIRSELSRIDKTSEERHNAYMQTLENKSKAIIETLNHQSSQISSFNHWSVIFAALGLLGIWISAILLLFRI